MPLIGKKQKVKRKTKACFKKISPAHGDDAVDVSEADLGLQNRNIVLNYIVTEMNKESSSEAIAVEYTEKVILYGFLIVKKTSYITQKRLIKF